MVVVLACIEGPPKGKRLEVHPGKGIPFKIRLQDHDAGQVMVELVGGQCVLTNRSELPCVINGEVRQRSVLHHGDKVVIGKSTFEMRQEDVDGSKTQALDHERYLGEPITTALPTPTPPPSAVDGPVVSTETTVSQPRHDRHGGNINVCSVCDGPFTRSDGWSGNGQRICHNCIEKGVRPDHLPHARGQTNAPEPLAMPEAETAPRPPVRQATVETTISRAQPRGAAKIEARHAAKRISASRLSVVEPDNASGGILRKMSSLLGNRGDKSRLELLVKQREEVLVEAGRLSMGAGGILGLSESTLQNLLDGKTVTIDPEELSGSALDQWRSERERILVLDTEIAALRRALGLGHDPDSILLPAPPLRAEVREQKDRAFLTLDGVSTENLEGDAEYEEPATPAPATPPPKPLANHSSGVRRAVQRRRR